MNAGMILKTVTAMTASAALVAGTASLAYAGDGSCSYSAKADKGAAYGYGEKKAEKVNIVETAAAAGSFNTLLAAATAAGLAETLSTGGPFTVFAPTDAAFAALPAGTVESLLKPENIEQLKAILLYHVVEGEVPAKTAVTLSEAPTLQGGKIALEVVDGALKLNGNSTVVTTDVLASNGVIHVIDAVLMPPTE